MRSASAILFVSARTSFWGSSQAFFLLGLKVGVETALQALWIEQHHLHRLPYFGLYLASVRGPRVGAGILPLLAVGGAGYPKHNQETIDEVTTSMA